MFPSCIRYSLPFLTSVVNDLRRKTFQTPSIIDVEYLMGMGAILIDSLAEW